MNKSVIGGVALGLLLPALSLGITPTREALLGLAPDAQILELADQIDTSRVDNEIKVKALELVADEQKAKLDEQQALIDSQKSLVEKTTVDVVATNVVIAKNSECSTLRGKYGGMCNDKERYSVSLTDFLKKYKKDYTYPGHDVTQDDLDVMENNYKRCNELYAKCD